MKVDWVASYITGNVQSNAFSPSNYGIGYFRVAVNIIMKARLGASFSYEN